MGVCWACFKTTKRLRERQRANESVLTQLPSSAREWSLPNSQHYIRFWKMHSSASVQDKSSVQLLRAEQTPGYSRLGRCSLSQILSHPGPPPNMDSQAVKGCSCEVGPGWHISGESKLGFPTGLHHTQESSLWFPAWLLSSGTRQVPWNFSQLFSTAAETAPWVESSLLNHSFPVPDLRNFCLMLLSQKTHNFLRKKIFYIIQLYGIKG